MRKGNTCEWRVQSRGENRPPEGIVKPGSSQYGRYSRSRKQSTVALSLNRQKIFLGVSQPSQPAIIASNETTKSFYCGEMGRLPPRLKVAFTEHMYLISSLAGSCEKLLQSFSKVVERVVSEQRRFQESMDRAIELQNRVQYLQLQVEELSKQAQGRSGKLLANAPNYEAENTRLMLQNNRLGALNQSLIKRLNEMAEPSKNQSAEFHLTDKSEDHQTEQLGDRIKYLTLRLSNEQSNNFVLMRKVQDSDTHGKMLVQALKGVTTQMQEQEQLACEWRQRALMQREDSDSLAWRQNYLILSIKKLTDMNKKLTSNLVSNNQQKRSVTISDRGQMFQYQADFFKGIRSMYEDNRQQQYKYSLKGKADQLGLEFDGPQFDGQYNRVIKAHEVYLPQYSFYWPSFYKFIQQPQQQQKEEQNRTSELSRSFVQKMRCIMLSKLNQFIVEDKLETCSRFPEFVYTWFDRYDFDTDYNEITVLQLKQDNSTLKRFYQQLMNAKLDQSWQVIAFREFLLEELGLEQLYFYLQCQNLLFRRAGITRRLQLLGELTILVEYNAVRGVLDIILSEFDTWNISFLTSKLNEKVVVRNGLEYIDSSFFLRCLLEYYKIERTNRLKLIKKMHQELCGESFGPTFQQFMRILDRFSELPIQTKVRLYRNCYSVGRGLITPQIIFTVCTEERVFLKYLRMKCFYKLPIQIAKVADSNSKQAQMWVVQPNFRYLEVLFEQMRKFLGDDPSSTFWSRMLGLGVHQLADTADLFRKYFNRNTRCTFENSVLKCRHFVHWLGQFGKVIRQVSYHNLYDILEETDKKSTGGMLIDIDENELGSLYLQHFEAELRLYEKTSSIIAWKRRVHQFRLNGAARKIQRQVRNKFIKPYLDIYNLMFEKVKKLRNSAPRRR